MINKKDILKNIDYWVDEFPTLPTIYTALSDVISNPRSTVNDAANIISQDQSSVAKLLKVANSSFYGFRSKIETVTQAIFYIGFEEVKNIILAISIMDIFKASGVMKVLNPVELWKHSISVGVGTRLIGATCSIKELENYFIAGILHDIGKLLFIRNLDRDYSIVIDTALEKGISLRQSEIELFGISHTVAGELIADKWKLSGRIKTAISNHHSGVDGSESDFITSSVHLANIISKSLSLGFSGDNIVDQPNINVWQKLQISPKDFQGVFPSLITHYDESLAIFKIE